MSVLLLALATASAEIRFESPPVVGEPVVIVVERDGRVGRGETVRVVHRPGTVHERERAIGITDGRGRVGWTPEEGGVAEVRAADETLPVHVRWAAAPTSTLTALLLVFLTGLGMSLAGLRRRTRRVSRRS
jgi:hypothetical protein